MRTSRTEGAALREKLSVKVESIDDADYLRGFIERITEPDNKLDEVEGLIRSLRTMKDFMDQHEITVESESFSQYLEMLNWSRTFRHWMEQKKQQLLNLKDHLVEEMKHEKRLINETIARFS